MSISNSNTDSTSASFEDIVALLKDAGWVAEASAAVDSGSRAQISVDCTMTQAQAWVVRAIGSTRRQGVLPCWIPGAECVVWAHSAPVEEWESFLPECYWNCSATGVYEYVSCTGNTMAAVLPDGVVRGRTLTTAARLAARPVVWGAAPPYCWEMRLDALVAQYWATLASFHKLPDGRGSREGKELLREADTVLTEARGIAAAAMGRGAPEWVALPSDWLGDSPVSGCPHTPR